jgi:DNA-binding NarL/FixJ family response regulator
LRILLVEDSDADALRMRRSLERSMEDPPRFARALDLAEGISRCVSEKFDVVLLDLNLPDSLGIETVERFMGQSFDPQPAVVVLTSEDDESLASQALRLGVEDYLVKGEFGPRPVHRILLHSIERHQLAMERGPDEGAPQRAAAPALERHVRDVGAPVRRIREEAAYLARSIGDAVLADRVRGIERDAERIAELLEALERDR